MNNDFLDIVKNRLHDATEFSICMYIMVALHIALRSRVIISIIATPLWSVTHTDIRGSGILHFKNSIMADDLVLSLRWHYFARFPC